MRDGRFPESVENRLCRLSEKRKRLRSEMPVLFRFGSISSVEIGFTVYTLLFGWQFFPSAFFLYCMGV